VSSAIAGTTAAQTISPDVKAQADREWRAILEPLLPLGAELVSCIDEPENPQLRQELYQTTLGVLVGGYLTLALLDPGYPRFVPYGGQDIFNAAGTNPDYMYSLACVADDGVYKVSGYRGTTLSTLFQIGSGNLIPRGDGDSYGTVTAAYEADSMHIGKDGYFEFILSRERPKDYQGEWRKLPESSTYVLLRQAAYNWAKEVDGRIAIQRLDQAPIRPRLSAEEVAANLKQLTAFTRNNMAMSLRLTERFRKDVPVNTMGFISFTGNGGMPAQHYLEGPFDLQPDEALILETEVPEKCSYWGFQVTDERYTALDWRTHMTSINGFDAKLDKDGKFRAVVSAKDPGVPNWLDTAGYQRGIIQGRWKDGSSTPLPTMTKVKLDDVRRHLPVDTPTVTTQQREVALRLRDQGAQFRRQW
jgi:hypothetical protein